MGAIPIDAEGRFGGYASVFGRVDAGGDMVMRGAFRASLAQRRDRIRMLFQHDPKEPVGTWDDLREDEHGLFVSGRLVPGVPRADALKRLIERRALDGLSIGFRTVRATREGGHRNGYRTYIVGALMLLVGVAQLLGIDVPSLDSGSSGQMILEALAVIFLRKSLKGSVAKV